ncbi:MAG TPA: ribosome biogenesis GTP-binding protein YihA/YsxC [Candidatus Hydrogenedentes bacterium]|nr:YihA family ribosome biogenesis GTP-binding protein [Candidatus Hydrogenedentota bacterium]HOJ69433.1 ribosome biogenesis GTP-binding protein YihA/YsxC [Candidatus Hydrogenedentota bacterium]HOK88572.1 ribosome biogenesis GTP-binding protein YihA/YsxC [Candidatus Hydrogenedentota bacterium]
MRVDEARLLKIARKPGDFPRAGQPEVAFAGRSNVGKSSLLNALTRTRNLARTSATPGKTQAIHFFEINRRYLLVDLPGYGFARAPMTLKREWESLMRGYLLHRPVLRAVAVLLDIRHDPSPLDHDMLDLLEEARVPVLLVATKADKIARGHIRGRLHRIQAELGVDPDAVLLPVSAETGMGIPELWDILETCLAGNAAGEPPETS